MKGALPTTLHELFCSLVLCCIVREQATHEPDTSLPELSSLDDLPDDLKTKLNNLSILAYNGVMQNKVVFYSKDLQVSHLPSNLSSLGLLQGIEGLTLYSKSLSYNFLHLSVQELLAAYYISHLVPSEQVKVFKKIFERSRFQAVLNFYSGFTKLANPEIQAFISSFQTKKSSFKDVIPDFTALKETDCFSGLLSIPSTKLNSSTRLSVRTALSSFSTIVSKLRRNPNQPSLMLIFMLTSRVDLCNRSLSCFADSVRSFLVSVSMAMAIDLQYDLLTQLHLELLIRFEDFFKIESFFSTVSLHLCASSLTHYSEFLAPFGSLCC